jgi:hypothetical protein
MARELTNSKGIWWLIAGVLCIGLAYLIGNRYNWEPLKQSVVLAPGPVETSQFNTDKDGYYEIAVDVEKGGDQERAACLLGMDPAEDARGCQGMSGVVDISWSISRDGQKVAEGTSADSREVYTADRVGRVIGEFWGTRGSRYALALKVNKDGKALASADPKLIVKMNDEDSKDYAIVSQILFFGGISFGFVGVVLMLNASAKRDGPKEDELRNRSQAGA